MSVPLTVCVFMACVVAAIAQCYPGAEMVRGIPSAYGCAGMGQGMPTAIGGLAGGFGAFGSVINPSNEMGLGYPSTYPYLGSYQPHYGTGLSSGYPIVYPSLSSYPPARNGLGMGMDSPLVGLVGGGGYRGFPANENVNENSNTNVNVNGASFRRGLHLPNDDQLNSNVNVNGNINSDFQRPAMIPDW